jgi:hypothetical protein
VLVIDDAEPLDDETLEVDAPPTYNTMHRPIRTGRDKIGQFRLLVAREA